MAKRKTVSVRTRFEVFKRDGFRCIYCGLTPVAVVLVADHVIPVSDGGSSTIDNLVTACKDCNAGKSNVSLRKKAAPLSTAKQVQEHADQIAAYMHEQKKVMAARKDVADALADCWEQAFGYITETMYARLPDLAKEWPIEKLIDAISIAGRRIGKNSGEFRSGVAVSQTKYFYGILRKWREA